MRETGAERSSLPDRMIGRIKEYRVVAALVVVGAALAWLGSTVDALGKVGKALSWVRPLVGQDEAKTRAAGIVARLRGRDVEVASAAWLDLSGRGAETELLVAYSERSRPGGPSLVPDRRDLIALGPGGPRILLTADGYAEILIVKYGTQYIVLLEPNGGNGGGRILTVYSWDGVGPLVQTFQTGIGPGRALVDRGVLYAAEPGRHLVLRLGSAGFALTSYSKRLDPLALGIEKRGVFQGPSTEHILRVEAWDPKLRLSFDGAPIPFHGEEPVARITVGVSERVFIDDNVGQKGDLKILYQEGDPITWEAAGLFSAFRFDQTGQFDIKIRSGDWYALRVQVTNRDR